MIDRATQPRFIAPADYSRWDQFVRSHIDGLIYHSSHWKKAVEAAFPHIRGDILVQEDSSGAIVAGIPIFVVRSWLLGTRVVSVPFSTCAGPLALDNASIETLLHAVSGLAKRVRARRTEIRTHGRIDPKWMGSFRFKSAHKHHYIPLVTDPADIFRTLSRTSVQQQVKKAAKSGLRIAQASTDMEIAVFHDLLTRTRMRLGLPPIPLRFFSSLRRNLGPCSTLYLATLDDEVVGGLITSHFSRVFSAEFIGDARTPRAQGVSHLLYWRAIETACAEGFGAFSFGRTAAVHTELIRFKDRWGTISEDLLDWSDETAEARTTRERSLAYRVARSSFRHQPARVAKFLGEMLYRHMG